MSNKNQYIQSGGSEIDISKIYTIIINQTKYPNISFYQSFIYDNNLKDMLLENLDCSNYNIINELIKNNKNIRIEESIKVELYPLSSSNIESIKVEPYPLSSPNIESIQLEPLPLILHNIDPIEANMPSSIKHKPIINPNLFDHNYGTIDYYVSYFD